MSKPVKLDFGEQCELLQVLQTIKSARAVAGEKGIAAAQTLIGAAIVQTDLYCFGDKIDEAIAFLESRLSPASRR